MTPWERAVEAGAKAMCDWVAKEMPETILPWDATSENNRDCYREDSRAALTAALPNLERHFREKFLAELRSEDCVEHVAHRVDDVAPQKTHTQDQEVARAILKCAADHLTRKEVP